MTTRLVIAPLVIVCAGLLGACASTPCALPAPRELSSEGPAHEPNSKRLARYDFDDHDVWWSEKLPATPSLHRFREAIRARFDVTQSVLLDNSSRKQPDPLTVENTRITLAQTHAIRPMRCLEAALIAEQTERLDMVEHPSEVLAFILRARGDDRLRIYTWTVNAAGIGRVGPIRERVEADLKTGQWRFLIAFHNHNFFVDKDDISGVVAPSTPDAQVMRGLRDDLGMEEAWISNGFDTGVWKGEVLDRFREPVPVP